MTDTLQNSAGRDRAIDVAKGLGMLLVVFGHTNYQEPLLTIIYSFHMPLFFALSGMMFRPDRYPTFGAFFRRKAKTLLLPFIIYAAITFVFTVAIKRYEGGFHGAYLPEMLKTAGQMLAACGSHVFEYNAPLWFVPCLFLVECAYYFVSKIKNTPLYIAAVTVLFVGGWALLATRFGDGYYVWNYPAAMIALSFFAIGHRVFAPTRKWLIGRGFGKGQWALVAAAGLALTVPLALLNGKISLGSDVVKIAPLLLLTGVCGSVFMLAISHLFTAKWVEFIGRNSFDYMAIQSLVRTGFTFAMMKGLHVIFWEVDTDYRYTLPMFAAVLAGTTVIVLIKNAVFRKRKKA